MARWKKLSDLEIECKKGHIFSTAKITQVFNFETENVKTSIKITGLSTEIFDTKFEGFSKKLLNIAKKKLDK